MSYNAEAEIHTVIYGSGDWVRRTGPAFIAAGHPPDVIIGNSDQEQGQHRIEQMGLTGALYIHPDQLDDAPIAGDAIAAVLSRNNQHVPDAEHALGHGIGKTYVDKPMGLSPDEAKLLANTYEQAEAFLYAGDHYLDAKSEGLQHIWGLLRSSYIGADQRSVDAAFNTIGEIGTITSVSAMLVEGGADPHGTIAGREWLADPTQAGALYDLMTHLGATGARFNFLDNQVKLIDARAELYDPQSGWRPVVSFGQEKTAEMFASVRYETASGVLVELVVGKIGTRQDIAPAKNFIIQGEHGSATLNFSDSRVEVNLHTGERYAVSLTADPYHLIVRNFLDATRGGRPNNIREAVLALSLVEKIKNHYNDGDASTKYVGHKGQDYPTATAA